MRVMEQAAPSAEAFESESQHEKLRPRPNQPSFRLVRTDQGEHAVFPESRLAVILAADVADYTRHMAKDEAGTHARFTLVYNNFVQPGIARHGARIVKNTGDGFIAEFWSATRAVWFGVDFQDALRAWNARRHRNRRLEFRV